MAAEGAAAMCSSVPRAIRRGAEYRSSRCRSSILDDGHAVRADLAVPAVRQARQARWNQQARQARQAPWNQQARQVRQARQARQARWNQQAQQAQQARQVQWNQEVRQAQQAQWIRQAQQAQVVRQVRCRNGTGSRRSKA